MGRIEYFNAGAEFDVYVYATKPRGATLYSKLLALLFSVLLLVTSYSWIVVLLLLLRYV